MIKQRKRKGRPSLLLYVVVLSFGSGEEGRKKE
jgi:hypothetical protein